MTAAKKPQRIQRELNYKLKGAYQNPETARVGVYQNQRPLERKKWSYEEFQTYTLPRL